MPSRIPHRRREEFSIRLSESDSIHVTFDKEKDQVVQFSVQYLAFLRGAWRPVVRFDTAHGHAHMDISHADGSQETRELQTQDYSSALTWAIQQAHTHWEFYRERYQRELE